MNIFQNILPYGVFGKSRAINAENPTGEKGKGGMLPVILEREEREVHVLKT